MIEEGLDLRGLADVLLKADRGGSRGLNCLRGFSGAGSVAGVVGAEASEPDSDGLTNAATGAGHERHFAGRTRLCRARTSCSDAVISGTRSAVDGDDRAGDRGGPVAQQPRGGLGDLAGGGHTPDR